MPVDVVFAVVPFTDVKRPNIGISTLLPAVKKAGFSARAEYVSLQLAAWMGLELFGWIAELGDQLLLDTTAPSISLVGEWFFAGVLFPGQLPPDEEYLARFIAPDRRGEELIPALLEAREKYARRFVEYAAGEILKHHPRVVGFTSTFHQTCCCLAVAKLLKEAPDPPVVIFGGSNCEGEMGLQMIRSFPWIDYICTGEGDNALPEFLVLFLGQNNPDPPPGILRQGYADGLRVPVPVQRLDELPVPDFHEYFEALGRSGLEDVKPILLMETARGCWWGEKHHCTFCGLNGAGMVYRSKSPQRALSELFELSETYGLQRVDSVDNILDTRYIQTLFPELIRRNSELELFYEIKANLRYDQLKTLWRGGVRAVQPGIETFSNKILQLMRKGCTGLQNIQLLRWCEELAIVPAWNMLYGFPDEPAAEYEAMATLVPMLAHLPPPAFCIRVRMDRFSPLYDQAAEFGLKNVRAMEAYSYVYPLPDSELRNLAYFFEFEYGDGRLPADYARPLVEGIEAWEAKPSRLDAYSAGDMLVIVDTRPCARQRQHVFTGLAARIYQECDSAVKVPALARRVGALEPEVRAAVERFVDEKLMVEMDGQVLSLAVFRNREETAPSLDSAGETLVNVSAVPKN
ncbi:MAG TPA: RiPP maturation radical SAM C-methyltransferase [Bryobacteraceae bacterium]|jgi:ribosomal peptide maturation radical SAM protein 1|nr:RiPP maturation radical SAM C-methyltransferase [Bryobacteraceae bacterium]